MLSHDAGHGKCWTIRRVLIAVALCAAVAWMTAETIADFRGFFRQGGLVFYARNPLLVGACVLIGIAGGLAVWACMRAFRGRGHSGNANRIDTQQDQPTDDDSGSDAPVPEKGD